MRKKIAIIGAGISGLGCAYHLRNQDELEVTVFEKQAHIGGHSNTIDFSVKGLENDTYGIDTGFLVFNRQTYPRLVRLFEELNVPISESEMTFSVSLSNYKNRNRALEWAGTNINSIFTQRSNLVNLDFLVMLKDIIRFNRLAKKIAANKSLDKLLDDAHQSVIDFLDQHQFSKSFRDWYLLPMIGAIWSCPVTEMMHFPINTLINFCDNHGLLNISNRPQWLTVISGSREYVSKLVAALRNKGTQIEHDAVMSVDRTNYGNPQGIQITMQSGRTLNFDEVVFACHSDQALKMLAKPSPSEEYLLKAIPYQKNMAYVHTDESLLPANKRAWAAWNYSSNTPGDQSNDTASHVCVHYLINKLQPLPAHLQNQSIIVSLNPHPLPKEELVHSVIEYSHPLFNADAVTAQKQLPMIQGQLNTWYCGAWTGYGFHEDGLKSGELVAEDIIQSLSKKTMHQSPSSNQLQ